MSIEKRPSKRHGHVYEVRLRDPRGREYSRSFRTRREAAAFEAQQRADRSRGSWMDPRGGKLTLGAFAEQWMNQKSDLTPATRVLYEGELRLHILPVLGDIELARLSPSDVRNWHAAMSKKAKPGPVGVAKCYRLLRAILNTAVDDELIAKNPCSIKNAGVERSPERPIATVPELETLAAVMEPRFKAMLLLAAWCSLRLGELLGLTRSSIDLLHGTIRVTGQRQEVKGADGLRKPKSQAGVRTITIPEPVVADVERHLAEFSEPGANGFVFTGPKGGPLRRATFYKAWRSALAAAGMDNSLKPHDLRHTGNTLAAATGASTKELMARMGQSSPRAALLYQHATQDRDEAIAAALGDLMTGAAPAPKAAVIPLVRRTGENGSRDERGMKQ